jgi:predicted PurR-regulated permease PerM/methanogenic corrinoid protein MtbC1
MSQADHSVKMPRFILLGSVCITVAALYFAQEVLIPLALAALLSFLLAPLVTRLEHFHLPRVAAVIVTVLIAFAILFGIGWVVFDQLHDLDKQSGTYRAQIIEKLHHMREKGGILNMIHSAGAEVTKALNAPATEPSKTDQTAEVMAAPVNGTPSQNSPFDLLRPIGAFLLGPVGTAFVVTVFAIFMLLQREDLRDRLIRLVGRNRLTLTTKALDDAAERVSRYLLMQSIVNGSVGVVILLLLLGVGHINGIAFPAVALWGMMSALLRFIPYVGIWVSAIMPLLLSLAVYPGAKAALEVLGCYLGVELVAANAVEPLLFGSSTGIATLAVLVAAAFWTWLWGPVGLLLSTPLTVCLVVMGKYVPQLEFLTILLAEEPALSPPERIYQRLLALDQEEAEDLIHEYNKKMSLDEVYDTVLTPALSTAELDAHRGNLTDDQLVIIQRGIRDIVDELGDRQRAAAAKEENATPQLQFTLPKGCTANVVCLPANDESDEIAAQMLAHLLQIRGYCVKVASVSQLASEMVDTVKDFKADIVCISALPPAAVTHARYLCKRLHSQYPDTEMVVGLWITDGNLDRAMDRIASVHPVRMASNFTQAIDQIHQLAQRKLLSSGQKETAVADAPG